MTYKYTPKGVCSSEISFDIDDDGIVKNVHFVGGCSGNTQGISKLAEGRRATELVDILKGIKCGFKNTSCPDKLAEAILEALK